MTFPDYQPPTKSISVKSVYGVDEPVIPCTWEATGEFRPPVKGETYLDSRFGVIIYSSNISDSPRIILRKIKRIVFTYVDTRIPVPGDWFTDDYGNFLRAPGDYWTKAYRIYRRTEE